MYHTATSFPLTDPATAELSTGSEELGEPEKSG